MGLGGWLAEWRETYDAYPVATAVTWGELLLGVGLMPAALVYPVFASRLHWGVGVALVAVSALFAVWFTVLRRPVMERLLE
jgi:hypothetical protein